MQHRNELEDWLKRYHLAIDSIEEVDLRICYMQQRPNKPFDAILCDKKGIVNSSMENSPHHELARLYISEGRRQAEKKFKSTRYYKMLKIMGKEGFPSKLDNLIKSLRKGYLRKEFKWGYVVALQEPFAHSRYKRKVPMLAPEIWSGHHRAGILLAMKQYIVPVVFAKDMQPGSCYSAGKIHGLCIQ